MKRVIGVIFAIVALLIPSSQSADTDVGVEWINTYPVCGHGELGGRDNVAVGFYNVLTGAGYTGRFNFGNGAAWADDFMDQDVVAAGTDHNYIDTVDIAYHADHGNVGIFGFGVSHSQCIVSANDCRWGDDYDLEWIVLDDCSCLRQGQYGVWWQTFQRLHMILSFDTNAHDDGSRGQIFANKLVAGWSVKQAWFYAAEQTEGPSTYAAIAGACNGNTSIYNERIWKFGTVAADPVPLAWWWWTHHQC
jgi:hypothetical protein